MLTPEQHFPQQAPQAHDITHLQPVIRGEYSPYGSRRSIVVGLVALFVVAHLAAPALVCTVRLSGEPRRAVLSPGELITE